MPRPKKAPEPVVGPNAIVASAARVVAGRRKNLPAGQGSAWQNEAWEMLDTVGELEFYREWISNALSRCTLSVVEVLEDGTEKPVTEGPAYDVMRLLFDGEAGQSEMLATMGGHLAIPGETWLCGLIDPPEDPSTDQWRVLSRDEVKQQGNKWAIDRGDGVPELYDDDAVYLTRIWRPHPRKWVEAHSSVRSALPILRELVGLSKHVAATIDSRLAGAGLLVVPSEVTFAAPAGADVDPEDPELDPLMAALMEAMVTAIENRGDASALVPLILKAPAEHLDKIKHITLSTPLSAEARELRKEAIERLASSLDIPAEVLTGMADVNHWTGWLLDDNAIKMHIEPLLAVLTGGITTRYLWPCLQGEAEALDPALRRFKVKGDTANLRQRPNRTAEAQALHAAMVITDEALARETGFEVSDLLAGVDHVEEFKRRLLVRAAGGVQTADVTVAALLELGVALTPQPSEAEPDAAAPPAVEGPAPAAPPAPVDNVEGDRDIPSQTQATALLAVAEVMVLRAVERGWNRAGRRGRVRKPVPEHELDAALSDAWGHIPRAAALTGVDSHRLKAALDGYTRQLLTTGAEHEPLALGAMLVSDVLNAPPAIEAG